MKIKTLFISMLAIGLMAACSKENTDPGGKGPGISGSDVAYMSIQISAQALTRASDEDPGETEESELKSLYFITFDASGKVIPAPGTSNYFTSVTPDTEPDPFKVSASAAKLLVVANPGTKLMAALNDLTSTSNFSSFNSVISGVDKGEITDEGGTITKGFAMISSGSEEGKSVGAKISDPLVDISSKIKKVTETVTEEQAKADAAGDRAEVKIERLASKVAFKLKGSVDTKGATFNFSGWVLDAVNTEFYPYAEKTLLSVAKPAGGFYKYNFYTQDPNFSGTVGAGLRKATIDPATYAPILPVPYTWTADGKTLYAIENTMEASYQQFGNATRVVVKGEYFPKDFATDKDWFNADGKNFKTLADMQTAYGAAVAGSNLIKVCDRFYTKVYDWLDAKGEDVSALTGFADLDQTLHLDKVTNGGEVVKDGKNPIVRWFQKGLCYYYNELRHDNASKTDLSFGKYGVVRNNWYSLTLAYVYGPGTPWYPDVDEPGPDDPDPTDPIDDGSGYLGVEVEVAPWIIWDNEIGF